MEREFYYSKNGTKVMVVAPIGELESIVDRMDRFKYRYDYMLVIGNGFDLNLGLHTTYRDFVNSYTFKKIYVKRTKEKCSKREAVPSILDYLYGKKFIEKWYDIEQALLEYVSPKPDGSFVNNVKDDKKDYELICKALIRYLAGLFVNGAINIDQFNEMKKSAAGQILKVVKSKRNILYSFNYTPINIITKIATYIDESKVPIVRPHGEITDESIIKAKVEDNSIILGIETNNINSIAPDYSFLLKSNNPAYKSTHIASDLLQTRNVIIFGHSLNQMDFGYFREYFEYLTQNTDRNRQLTIITKDNKSRVSLLDNLRKSGISVRDVFAHTNVEIILSDDIGKKDTESDKLFCNLLEKIDTDLYR